MVQVHLEACLPDVRVAPVKMIGASSPRRSANGDDRGAVQKTLKTYARSRSARGSAGEEDVYGDEFGGPAERAASRASSRSKSRIAKDARAELLGLEEGERNAVRPRELRSRSAARVREGVDIEMDGGEKTHIEVSKSRSSSRMRGRGLKESNETVTLQEALQDSGERDPRTVRALKNSEDGPEILYTGRGMQPTQRASSRAGTPRSSVRISREQEDSRAPPEVPGGEKEFRSPNVGRRLLVSSLDPEDEDGVEERERVSYRIPTRSPRQTRENSDLPEERLLRVERLTRKPGRSPRKAADEATDMQVEPVVAQSERVPRRNVRKADVDGPEDEEDDGTGLHRRGKVVRQPKRKVRDIPRDPAVMLPVSHPPECEMLDVAPVEPADPPLMASSPTTSSRSSRDTSNSRIAWLHVLGDLIMWRDVPRSTLWFGAGSFSILSASFMQEMHLGIVAISANLALCYLAMVFFYRTFLRGLPVDSTGELNAGRVTEADFLGWIRFALPAINLALKKAREVFSGDPATTLRVAIVLWLVAKMGAGISIWSFLRFGFFALFTIPKCHSNYSTQIYAFGQSLLVRAWMTWDSFAHKKAMLIGGFLLAWNISSYPSRLWGGFILVVWLKLYQQSNPASFEKALADASRSSAIDRIDRRKSLQHASQAAQGAPVAEELPSPQTHPVQEFPGK
ncbi:hypothetical protein M758_1G172400 [Ceratodon purpureus]|nr:hypothetical protein M758_1G172400 [Ceratodon purpureus]